MNFEEFDAIWILFCAILVFSMQAGFLCLEVGVARRKNAINVAIKNSTDFSISFLVYFLFGFAFMFGNSYHGVIGTSLFSNKLGESSSNVLVFFIFQAMFCGTAITITSGAVLGRMKFIYYVVLCVVVSSLVYPIFGHWAWANDGNGNSGWLKKLGFIDFAGSTVVHSVGGWASLAGTLVLGPRLGLFFRSKGNIRKNRGSDTALSLLGVLILWIGWIGFNAGSALYLSDKIGIIIINTILCASVGVITHLAITKIIHNYYSAKSIASGAISGLVAITASVNQVSPNSAIIIGVIAVILCIIAEEFLIKKEIDDPINAIPTHLVSGIWGTLCVAIFSDDAGLSSIDARINQLGIQLIGIAACGIWTFGLVYTILKVIDKYNSIRVSSDAEEVGLNITEHNESTEINDLIGVMDDFAKTNDFSIRADADSFTEAGRIAYRYNMVVEKLEQIIMKFEDQKEEFRLLTKVAPDGIVQFTKEGVIQFVNDKAEEILDLDIDNLIDKNLYNIISQSSIQEKISNIQLDETVKFEFEYVKSEKTKLLFMSVVKYKMKDMQYYLSVFHDSSEKRMLQKQVEDSQKLEAIGQLAAGVAHEINTPIQYINDNTQFIQDAFEEIMTFLKEISDKIINAEVDSSEIKSIISEITECLDLEFLEKQIPKALSQSIDGINRVAEIVKAMKDFSHPGSEELIFNDINNAINSTATVCRNRWKYIADLELNLEEELPLVYCNLNQINQVVLNLIVNSADAISDQCHNGKYDKGLIKITTSVKDDLLKLTVSDNGGGIPSDVKENMFNPFYTTKPIGKGTGQGLAIIHDIIVSKHGGTIECNTEEESITKFIITIPVNVNSGKIAA